MTCVFSIRPAFESDLPSIVHLDASSNPHPWGNVLVADALHARSNWIVEVVIGTAESSENPQILGWLTASQCLDQSELELIVVDVSARRQGLAKQLMSAWQKWALENGTKEFLLEVRESNHGAIGLYQSLGFEQVGRRKNYYRTKQGHEAACLFTLTI